MNSLQTAHPETARAPKRLPVHRREPVLLLVEGLLDLPAAHRLAAAARRRAAEADVRIDLRRARVYDVALAALVRKKDDRIEIVGLSRHHERLLGYLGAGAARTREAAVSRTAGRSRY